MLLFILAMQNPTMGVIDRIEGSYAVVEWQDRSVSDLPRAILPPECGEGSLIQMVLVYKESIGFGGRFDFGVSRPSLDVVVFAGDGRSRCFKDRKE